MVKITAFLVFLCAVLIATAALEPLMMCAEKCHASKSDAELDCENMTDCKVDLCDNGNGYICTTKPKPCPNMCVVRNGLQAMRNECNEAKNKQMNCQVFACQKEDGNNVVNGYTCADKTERCPSTCMTTRKKAWEQCEEYEKFGCEVHRCDGGYTCTAPKPCVGKLFGDPHIVTYDGARYGCGVGGEFLVTRRTNLFPRFRMYARFHEGTGFAFSTAVAFKHEGIPTIQVEKSHSTGCELKLRVGGEEVDLPDPDGETKTEQYTIKRRREKGRVVVITFYTGIELFISAHSFRCRFEYIQITIPPAFCKKKDANLFAGLLGTPDGNKVNDLMLRRGGYYKQTQKKENGFCAQNWCNRQDGRANLFTYEDGKSFADYYNCDKYF